MKSLFSEPEIISEERGDQKTIKGSSSQREIYVVQQGDTMSSISRKFNIPEIKLRELNKLRMFQFNIQTTAYDIIDGEDKSLKDLMDENKNYYYLRVVLPILFFHTW